VFSLLISDSPTDFVRRAIALSSDLYGNNTDQGRAIITLFLLDVDEWRELSNPFTSRPIDPTLAMIHELLPLELVKENAIRDTPLINTSYDTYGLSLYGRAGVFTTELVKTLGVQEFFFVKDVELAGHEEKSAPSRVLRNSALLELLLLNTLSDDIHSRRERCRHIWDATRTDEENNHVLSTFLVDVWLIACEYISYSLQMDRWDIEQIAAILSSINSGRLMEVSGLTGLIVEAFHRTFDTNGIYWNRVANLLISRTFETMRLSASNAELLLEAVKTHSRWYQ
jgi:hypothetical protein